MKKSTKLLFIVLPLFIFACSQPSASTIATLEPTAFSKQIETDKKKVLLDVRTEREYNQGHIKGAILMDIQEDGFKAKIATLDSALPIYVYCKSGVRSDKAAQILAEKGFKSVFVLQGGIEKWVDEGKVVE